MSTTISSGRKFVLPEWAKGEKRVRPESVRCGVLVKRGVMSEATNGAAPRASGVTALFSCPQLRRIAVGAKERD
jgi:hypothetical protein